MLRDIILILTMAIVTMFTRMSPSLIFNKDVPPVLQYLGKVLPSAIVGMLVVYCLESVNVEKSPFGAPEFIASICVAILHAWKRNALISIFFGTIIYMVLFRVMV